MILPASKPDLIQEVERLFDARIMGPGMYSPGPNTDRQSGFDAQARYDALNPTPIEITFKNALARYQVEEKPSQLTEDKPSINQIVQRSTELRQERQQLMTDILESVDSALIKALVLPTWFTSEGARLKVQALKKKGIPIMKNWRAITVTIDPSKVDDDPLLGMKRGKKRINRFTRKMRAQFGEDARWCAKMEFHSDGSHAGWPHWHVLFEYTTMMTIEELKLVEKFWGLGRTKVQRVEGDSMEYVFKYATKAHNIDIHSPELAWFLHYLNRETGQTFERCRFWQTSKGFYTGKKPKAVQPKPKQSSLFYLTVAERLQRIKDGAFKILFNLGSKSHTRTLSSNPESLVDESTNEWYKDFKHVEPDESFKKRCVYNPWLKGFRKIPLFILQDLIKPYESWRLNSWLGPISKPFQALSDPF